MQPEAVVDAEAARSEHGGAESKALVVCSSCEQLVPKTNTCLYCGAPILLKKPR